MLLTDTHGRYTNSIDVSKEQMSRYQIYELRALHVAVGDLVELQEKVVLERLKHHKKQVFQRGSVHKLFERSPEGTLIFEGGLKLSENDGRITPGYVSTSIPSQGMTADRVWAYESSISAKASATCQSMYVVATRHRQEFKLFTEDAVLLEQAASRVDDRLSTIELVRGENAMKKTVEVSKAEGTMSAKVDLARDSQNFIVKRRIILDQIES